MSAEIETAGGTGKASLSALLAQIAGDAGEERLTLAHVIDRLGERSFGCVLLILALPAWFPVLPPPMRSIFGLPIGLIAVQMLLGRPGLAIPGWLGRRSLPRERARQIVARARPWLERAERLTRPRMARFAGRAFQSRLGAFVLLAAALILVPLPMTGSGPALATAVIALGLIERDGKFVVVGLILGLVSIAVTIVFWTGVWLGLSWTLDAAR